MAKQPDPARVQFSRDELKGMTSEQIAKAHERGQLAQMLTGETPHVIPAEGPLSRADVAELYRRRDFEAILAAHQAGRIPTTSTD